MSWIDKALELGSMLDVFSNAAEIVKAASPDYLTISVRIDGRSANDMARDLGPGWEVGFIDHDAGLVWFHRRRK